MKKTSTLFLISLLLLVSIACTTQTSEKSFLKYNGQQYSINYPSDWTIRTQANVVAFVSPKEGTNDKFMENLNIILSPSTKDSLDKVVEDMIVDVKKSFDNFNMLSKENQVLSGIPVFKMTSTASRQGQSLKFIQWLGKKENAFFLITYTAFPEGYESHLSDAEKIVDSFEMK